MSREELATQELSGLLERVRSGDEAALAALVERYSDALRRAARARLGDALQTHLDSVDLVQSVQRILLLGLRQNKFEFSDHERLLSLALTLIRRRVARHWRRLKNQPEASAAPDEEMARLADPATSGHGTTPEQCLTVSDQFEQLVDGLDPIDRQMLELRMAGSSTADAAREMGVEPAMLRVRLGRLRKRLRDEGFLNDWL